MNWAILIGGDTHGSDYGSNALVSVELFRCA